MACANVPGDRGPVRGGFIAGRAYGGTRNHMDHLTATEKQITWAAVAVVFLSIYSLANAWGSLMFVPLLAGLAALVILFLPRISPNTKAPGSKGSLLMVSGVLAAAFWLLAVLTWVGWIFDHLATLDTILFLIGFASALVFGWLSWQAFQAEGGKFQFGNTDMGTTTAGAAAATAAPPADPPASAPPPAAPPTAPPPASPPADSSMSSPADSGMSSPPSSDMGSSSGTGSSGTGSSDAGSGGGSQT